MIVINNTVLIGRLVRDVELKFLPSGIANSTFTLAVDRNLSKDKKAEAEAKGSPTADFIRIVVWGKQAENCADYLEKGRLVAVQGRINTGSYTKDDGSRVFTTDVIANNVEFLEWGDKKDNNDTFDYPGMEGFKPTDNDDIPF